MVAGACDNRCVKAFGEISSILTQFTGGFVPPKASGTFYCFEQILNQLQWSLRVAGSPSEVLREKKLLKL